MYHDILAGIATVVDVTAVLIMLIGFGLAVVAFSRANVNRQLGRRLALFQQARCELGAYLTFGLELMIISDLVHTIISHELKDLLFLALLVTIRTAIGYFLNREIQELQEHPVSD